MDYYNSIVQFVFFFSFGSITRNVEYTCYTDGEKGREAGGECAGGRIKEWKIESHEDCPSVTMNFEWTYVYMQSSRTGVSEIFTAWYLQSLYALFGDE